MTMPEQVPVPSRAELAKLLDRYAPLQAPELLPELRVFFGRSLVEVWEAAENLAGANLPAPFWAYPWAAGVALARVLLDAPQLVRGKRVLDLGTGGGVTALAAAFAGAQRVVANDIDGWALTTVSIAAERQGLAVEPLHADLTTTPSAVDDFQLVLCSDLAYERRAAPKQRALLERARRNGAQVLVADAGRTYFTTDGLVEVASFTLEVPRDLEGVTVRTARVFELVQLPL